MAARPTGAGPGISDLKVFAIEMIICNRKAFAINQPLRRSLRGEGIGEGEG